MWKKATAIHYCQRAARDPESSEKMSEKQEDTKTPLVSFKHPVKKIVKVLWMDAHTEEAYTEDDIAKLKEKGKTVSLLCPYLSVGYLLIENKEVIVIAPNLMPDDSTFPCETAYRRILFIPKSQVRQIWELKDFPAP